MYKNNSLDSNKFKGRSPLQLHPELKVLSFIIGYYSNTNRYIQFWAGVLNKEKFLLRKI